MSHNVEKDVLLTDIPIKQRDRMIAQVLAFLVERGYTITAPGAESPPVIPPEVTE